MQEQIAAIDQLQATGCDIIIRLCLLAYFSVFFHTAGDDPDSHQADDQRNQQISQTLAQILRCLNMRRIGQISFIIIGMLRVARKAALIYGIYGTA